MKLWWVLGLGLLVASGCKTNDTFEEQPKPSPSEISSEVSLKADRENLDQYRQNEPKEVQSKNDQEAKYLDWMAKVELKPEVVREKFGQWAIKTREDFDSRVHKLRDKFSHVEKSNRDSFLDHIHSLREGISKNSNGDRRKKALADLDQQRKDFIEKEHDDRVKFDSELREKISDFDFNMDQKRKEFAERIRDYTERYNAKKPKN